MKRTIAFAKRNFLELIRDPLSIIFNIGLPAVLLVLMATIDANIDDVSIFPIQSFAPGIIVFGGSFLTMFCAILVAKTEPPHLHKGCMLPRCVPSNIFSGTLFPCFRYV